MRNVVRGFEPRTIAAVTIKKSPPRWWSIRSAVDLHLAHVSGPSDPVRAEWEDWMLGGGFGRRLVAHGLRGTITLVGDYTGARIQPREFHTPDPQPVSAAQAYSVAGHFRTAAVRAGARVLEMRVGRPYGPAPSITLRVQHPARFMKSKLRKLLAFYDRSRDQYEGRYLGIVDARGRRALELFYSTRLRGGGYWVRPDLRECLPFAHSEGAIASAQLKPPPPYPA
jgi:hypothetical protein